MELEQKLEEGIERIPFHSCWEWGRGRTSAGYGVVYGRGSRAHRNMHYTHRLSYQIHCGPIPTGMQVLHSCDNPGCCNPAHLRLGDDLDNHSECARKGRTFCGRKTHCKRGHELSGDNVRTSTQNAVTVSGKRRVYQHRQCLSCKKLLR
jgi:hypothetical protein